MGAHGIPKGIISASHGFGMTHLRTSAIQSGLWQPLQNQMAKKLVVPVLIDFWPLVHAPCLLRNQRGTLI